MKKLFLALVLGLSLTFSSCIIQNTKPEDCVVETVKIIKISEGTSYDIVFHDHGTNYY